MTEQNPDSRTAPQIHQGPDHSAPYPVSRLAPAMELVDLAREIATADTMIGNKVNAQLEVIATQMRALQDQARQVLERAREDQALHHAECNFVRRPGSLYHLYRKPEGRRYFSMLSPGDWRGDPPDEFLGSYRLEADMSWTPAGRLDETGDHQAMVRALLQSARS